MRVRSAGDINELNTLHRIILTLNKRSTKLGVFREEILIQVVHCPHRPDVVLQESDREFFPRPCTLADVVSVTRTCIRTLTCGQVTANGLTNGLANSSVRKASAHTVILRKSSKLAQQPLYLLLTTPLCSPAFCPLQSLQNFLIS